MKTYSPSFPQAVSKFVLVYRIFQLITYRRYSCPEGSEGEGVDRETRELLGSFLEFMWENTNNLEDGADEGGSRGDDSDFEEGDSDEGEKEGSEGERDKFLLCPVGHEFFCILRDRPSITAEAEAFAEVF